MQRPRCKHGRLAFDPCVFCESERTPELCDHGRSWTGVDDTPLNAPFNAADELTQHDQDAGTYGDTCQCGEGAEHTPRIHP